MGRRGKGMNWLGQWVPDAAPFEYAEPVVWPYGEAAKLNDGRIRVTRSDGAGLSLTITEWRQAIADAEALS